MILFITQTAELISIEHTLIRKGSEDLKSTDKYNLDGKEIIEKNDMGITRKNTKWSDDRKSLTINTVMSFAPDISTTEYRVDDTYKLSDSGNTLTIESVPGNLPGERKIIKVYNKL